MNDQTKLKLKKMLEKKLNSTQSANTSVGISSTKSNIPPKIKTRLGCSKPAQKNSGRMGEYSYNYQEKSIDCQMNVSCRMISFDEENVENRSLNSTQSSFSSNDSRTNLSGDNLNMYEYLLRDNVFEEDSLYGVDYLMKSVELQQLNFDF